MSSSSSSSSSSWTESSSDTERLSTSSLDSEMHPTPLSKKTHVENTQRKHTTRHSEVNKETWAGEIHGKINVYNVSVNVFLEHYVASPFDAPRSATKAATVKTFSAVPKGKEVAKYPKLLAGLRKMAERIPASYRPQFADGSKCAIRFPFKKWAHEYQYTMPDILMSFPGEKDDTGKWAATWRGISMVIEVKPNDNEDPVLKGDTGMKHGSAPTDVLVQLAKSARNILHTHNRLFVYVVGIYGSHARIFRFDHASAVVSKSIDLKRPDALYQFLWRFCRGRGQPPDPSGAANPIVQRTATGDDSACEEFLDSADGLSAWGDGPPESVAPVSEDGSSASDNNEDDEQLETTQKGLFTYQVLGADPTVQMASEDDIRLIDEKLKSAEKELLSDEDKLLCRWVTFEMPAHDGSDCITVRKYLIYRLRFLNARIFSRATTTWEAFDTKAWESCVIKDAWRQLARDAEGRLYALILEAYMKRTLQQRMEDHDFMKYRSLKPEDRPAFSSEDEFVVETMLEDRSKILGIANVVCSADLGAREAKQLDATRSPTPSSSHSEGSDAGAGSSPPNSPSTFELCHQTTSAFVRDQGTAKYNERSHMRLVMTPVGRPLSEFKSTKELVLAIRDAIIGHRHLFKHGILHRDVSNGNVMICDDFFIGFLLDLDCGFDWTEVLTFMNMEISEENWRKVVGWYNKHVTTSRGSKEVPLLPPVDKDGQKVTTFSSAEFEEWAERMRLKERTGTLYFMAIQILDKRVAHDVQHDLESFFWLLLWIVLRHANHTDLPDNETFMSVFGGQDEADSVRRKYDFLRKPLPFEVVNNSPLTTLLSKFRKLCYYNIPKYDEEEDGIDRTTPLTYENVLALLNEALVHDWPSDDGALEFRLPEVGKGSRSQASAIDSRASATIGQSSRSSKRTLEQADDSSVPAKKRSRTKKSKLQNQIGPD